MNRNQKKRFRCRICGKLHAGLMTDVGSQLPDAVWRLGYVERYLRARHNADLCTLDDKRWFIRTIVPVPLTHADNHFYWGLWVEVSRRDHDAYIEAMEHHTGAGQRFSGRIANDLKAYRKLAGQKVEVEIQADHDSRPFAYLSPRSRHALAHEQRHGIDLRRHHQIVAPYT